VSHETLEHAAPVPPLPLRCDHVTAYLSAEDILLLHELLLAQFGGMRGITEQGFGRLETAAGEPRQSMFGEDLYATLADKAAALTRGIVRGHPFSDGNKRVMVLALVEFLQRNGAEIDASNDEIYQLAMDAARDMSREAIGAWVEARLR
jgi:death on curing protein